jgi:hypothetical protein
MTTSSDLSVFGLRALPFTREIDAADLWLPKSMAARLAGMSFVDAPIELLLDEQGIARDDDKEDDDGDR